MIRPNRLFVLALGSVVLSCAGGNNVASTLAKPPAMGEQLESLGGRCGVTKSQAKPLVVEWPSMARGELESKAADGLVPVRYVGCEMEVLGQCRVRAGQYRYKAITPKRDSIEMRDADDLYANVPLGAARLESKLEKSGVLKVAMTIVGRYEADNAEVTHDHLEGRDCSKATHVVTGLTTGAFHFYAEGSASVGAGAGTVFGGVGGASQSKREMITEDGDEAACEKASAGDARPPDRCGALIRVEVVPIGEAAPVVPVCPAGSEWDGQACMRKNVVTQVECPAGTKWDGSQCAAQVNTSCAAGMHFEAGRGCVPDVVAVAAVPEVPVKVPVVTTPVAAKGGSGGCPTGMAAIPGGSFWMGSDDGEADERPVHKVTVEGFCMDVTEVTVSAYAACVRSGECSPAAKTVQWEGISDSDRQLWSQFCNGNRSDRQNHPVNCVDWQQATTYCGAVGKRLPKEEEWEYAARSGSEQRTYPWGEEAPGPSLLNACGSEWVAMVSKLGKNWTAMYSGNDGWESTAPVGSYPRGRTGHGLFDMAGNVWEWTSSRYCIYPSKDCADSRRVLRGGSWDSSQASEVRAAFRNRSAPAYRDNKFGFRCARTR